MQHLRAFERKVYCGTLNEGLWITNDGGQTWTNMDKRQSFSNSKVMSVSINVPNGSND
jgi:hypothetical protein